MSRNGNVRKAAPTHTNFPPLSIWHPVIAAWREFTVSGALLSYGPDRIVLAKRIAAYVQKVLSNAKPGDLPIEQPTKFELVVNLKTARTIGLNINREFLLRADDLID